MNNNGGMKFEKKKNVYLLNGYYNEKGQREMMEIKQKEERLFFVYGFLTFGV